MAWLNAVHGLIREKLYYSLISYDVPSNISMESVSQWNQYEDMIIIFQLKISNVYMRTSNLRGSRFKFFFFLILNNPFVLANLRVEIRLWIYLLTLMWRLVWDNVLGFLRMFKDSYTWLQITPENQMPGEFGFPP